MVSASSIISGLGGALGGAVIVGGYIFVKGYLQQAGANAANKTQVLKADTVNRRNKEGNQNIVKKMEKLREEKKEIRREKETEIEEFKNELSDYERIIESIQDESVARKRLIENYWKPLHALVACFTKSKIDTDEGETNFVLDALRRGRDVEQITGSTYIVPPKDVPNQIKSKPDSRAALETWIEDEVYSDYPDALAHIAMFGLVDLRNVYSSSDYEADDLPHFFSTVDWEFDLEDIFDSEDFSRLLANESVNLTEIIEKGDIAFFVSKSVSPEELDDIHEAQTQVEEQLGNPNVKQLAEQVTLEQLIEVLTPYVSDPQSVAESVKEEAGIWNDQLYS
jgi:hypothetical protein